MATESTIHAVLRPVLRPASPSPRLPVASPVLRVRPLPFPDPRYTPSEPRSDGTSTVLSSDFDFVLRKSTFCEGEKKRRTA